MAINKTTHVQHDTPTKNRFISAMEATGRLCESAAKYGIKWSTTLNLWTKYKNTGTTKNLPCSGHPPKLSDCGQWLVVWNWVNECWQPFQQIMHDTMMNISEHTVCDVAADAGYHQWVVRKVPFLSALQKRKRISWANEFRTVLRLPPSHTCDVLAITGAPYMAISWLRAMYHCHKSTRERATARSRAPNLP